MEAFKLVKANQGGVGVDNQSLGEFQRNLKDNLYKIWNKYLLKINVIISSKAI